MTYTLSSPEQVLAYVASILGFYPQDSVVIIGLTGGPMARVDAAPVAEIAPSLVPALRHWERVIVIGYGSGEECAGDVAHWLAGQGVSVVGVFAVDNGADVHTSTGIAEIDAKRVHASRADLEAEAAGIDRLEVAVNLAELSWHAGDGARVWVFLDRAVELNAGLDNARMAKLRRRLDNADDPREQP